VKKVSRRTFARDALVAATAAAVLPSVLAQTPPAPPKTTPVEPKPPATAPALSAASQAEVDARVNWILTKYGTRLDDGQRADIRRLLQGAQQGVDAMRAYPLDNGAEPAPRFRIYRRGAAVPKKVTK
jgi:hypothetical protein